MVDVENKSSVKLNLRLESELHRELTVEAKRSLRSLQSQIVWRLREALQKPDGVVA
jgi:predicted HicB family RNase H-like nuclease